MIPTFQLENPHRSRSLPMSSQGSPDQVQLKLGFKFGQSGTYSTLEFSVSTTSNFDPANITRNQVVEEDLEWIMTTLEAFHGDINQARRSIGLRGDWSLGGETSAPPGPVFVPAEIAVQSVSPGTYSPPPLLGLPLPIRLPVPTPVQPPQEQTPGWPQST